MYFAARVLDVAWSPPDAWEPFAKIGWKMSQNVAVCPAFSGSTKRTQIQKTNPFEPKQNRVFKQPMRFSVDSTDALLRNEPIVWTRISSPHPQLVPDNFMM